MAKKKTSGKGKPKRFRLGVRENYRAFLVRMPPDLAEWLENTAAELGISRDAFIRQLVAGCRTSFKAAEVAGSPESRLFRHMESRILDATERATTEAVERVLRSTGGVVPGKKG